MKTSKRYGWVELAAMFARLAAPFTNAVREELACRKVKAAPAVEVAKPVELPVIEPVVEVAAVIEPAKVYPVFQPVALPVLASFSLPLLPMVIPVKAKPAKPVKAKPAKPATRFIVIGKLKGKKVERSYSRLSDAKKASKNPNLFTEAAEPRKVATTGKEL